jgi:hypothetical protein
VDDPLAALAPELREHRGAVVLLTNSGMGRALYRSVFPDVPGRSRT